MQMLNKIDLQYKILESIILAIAELIKKYLRKNLRIINLYYILLLTQQRKLFRMKEVILKNIVLIRLFGLIKEHGHIYQQLEK